MGVPITGSWDKGWKLNMADVQNCLLVNSPWILERVTWTHSPCPKKRSRTRRFARYKKLFTFWSSSSCWWLNPSEKYACSSKWLHFPKFRGEKKKYLKPPPRPWFLDLIFVSLVDENSLPKVTTFWGWIPMKTKMRNLNGPLWTWMANDICKKLRKSSPKSLKPPPTWRKNAWEPSTWKMMIFFFLGGS